MNVDDALAVVREPISGYPNSYRVRRAAEVLADEVDHLRAELAATQDTLRELGDAWEEAAPMLDAALRDHPSAQPAALYVVKRTP